MALFCEKCGHPLKSDERFCENCGTARPAEIASGEMPDKQATHTTVPDMPTIPKSVQTNATSSACHNKPFIFVAACTASAFVLSAGIAFGVPAIRHASWHDILNQGQEQVSSSTSAQTKSTTADEPDTTYNTGETTSSEPEVRNTLNEYTWKELASISSLIAQADSDAEGLAIAQQYHLADTQGQLDKSQTKTVGNNKGIPSTVRIAGIRQDITDQGTPAGITFISTAPIATRQMNTSKTSSGGWQDSDMRQWLNGELLQSIDDDVVTSIITTRKPSNSVGYTSSASSVTYSDDNIWIPSLTEVGGMISRSNYEQGSEYVADIFNAESVTHSGPQYQLFNELGVDQSGAMPVLRDIGKGSGWWLRSASPRRDGRFMIVRADGTPGYGADANEPLGVIVGFCL